VDRDRDKKIGERLCDGFTAAQSQKNRTPNSPACGVLTVRA
jgi:hypothetical protein